MNAVSHNDKEGKNYLGFSLCRKEDDVDVIVSFELKILHHSKMFQHKSFSFKDKLFNNDHTSHSKLISYDELVDFIKNDTLKLGCVLRKSKILKAKK